MAKANEGEESKFCKTLNGLLCKLKHYTNEVHAHVFEHTSYFTVIYVLCINK